MSNQKRPARKTGQNPGIVLLKKEILPVRIFPNLMLPATRSVSLGGT